MKVEREKLKCLSLFGKETETDSTREREKERIRSAEGKLSLQRDL